MFVLSQETSKRHVISQYFTNAHNLDIGTIHGPINGYFLESPLILCSGRQRQEATD